MVHPANPPALQSHDGSESDHGDLPAWGIGDLPEPLPMSFGNIIRTIGPGAILLAGSIGGGEWIIGPLATVKHGTGILWVATLGIFLQMIFNLEAIRYTLYCGEPVVTGIMRLHPGSKFWGLFYVFVGFAQLATPAMAMSCANVLLTAATGRLPDGAGGDRFPLMWISWGVLLLTVILLQSGKSIEKVLERLSWGMVIFIFLFLLIANVLFVPLATSWKTLKGFFTPLVLLTEIQLTSLSDWKDAFTNRLIPSNMNWALLGVFAATAGSGGLGNLAISNWTRDKGLGMGRFMGSIGGALAANDEQQEVRPIGIRFLPTPDNLRRWGIWWKYSLMDQSILWAIGCVAGMFLNVNLAQAIVTPDNIPTDSAAGAFQAAYMAEKLWSGFWVLALVNGFWILFSTQLGNTDCLTRVSSDVLWAGFPKLRSARASRIYLCLLVALSVWGVGILAIGKSAFELFQYLGLIANPILAIGAFQILRVNTRFLPKPIQPPLWRRACLVLCGVVYGVLAAVSIYSKLFAS
ncbi:MAG: Nramp family divalent metal transporter [Planctomycetaceae bacterium]